MPVAHAAAYERVTVLWRRTVGSGFIECRLLRARRPAKRIVQLYAEYLDAGVPTTAVVGVDSPEEEARVAARLEAQIRHAGRLPDLPELHTNRDA